MKKKKWKENACIQDIGSSCIWIMYDILRRGKDQLVVTLKYKNILKKTLAVRIVHGSADADWSICFSIMYSEDFFGTFKKDTVNP